MYDRRLSRHQAKPASGHEAVVIIVHQVSQSKRLQLDASLWACGVKVVVKAVNEDAKKGCTEGATLP